jgi:hypothetical protein
LKYIILKLYQKSKHLQIQNKSLAWVCMIIKTHHGGKKRIDIFHTLMSSDWSISNLEPSSLQWYHMGIASCIESMMYWTASSNIISSAYNHYKKIINFSKGYRIILLVHEM